MNISGHLAKLLFSLDKNYKSYLEKALAPELTLGQLTVLEMMLEKENVKPSDFTSYLETTPAAVSMLLDRMEKSGLLSREKDPRDRRVVRLKLSAKGKSAGLKGKRIREEFYQKRLEQLSEHNQKLLIYLLTKIESDPESEKIS